MNAIISGIIAMFGLIVGAGLNELLRRRQRIEAYSPVVFVKRLEKYEELMNLVQHAYEIASDVMENTKHSPSERLDLISAAIMPIAAFSDENELYIDSDLGMHCVATFMGAEDVMAIDDEAKREKEKKRILEKYVSAKRMIREDSGVAAIDKLFKGIAKPHLSSPVIDTIRYFRKHPDEIEKLKGDLQAPD